MRDLYRALAKLALDAELRTKVKEVARVVRRADIPQCQGLPDMRDQPDLDALREIDKLLRTRNLYLGSYALGEINRWMVQGGAPFMQELETLGSLLRPAVPKRDETAFLEAVGALVSDENLAEEFRLNHDLRKDGFTLSLHEQDDLRELFLGRDDDPAVSARKVFKLGWPTSTCLTGFRIWEGMMHPNI
ncbi:MAG TPA: hypothetical protein VES20_08250 [Bryobacteraceae bacterium]|nr:hypothetical protein [Bryobacteraceae bacterium]